MGDDIKIFFTAEIIGCGWGVFRLSREDPVEIFDTEDDARDRAEELE